MNRTKLPGVHHALPILIPDSTRIERFDPVTWDGRLFGPAAGTITIP